MFHGSFCFIPVQPEVETVSVSNCSMNKKVIHSDQMVIDIGPSNILSGEDIHRFPFRELLHKRLKFKRTSSIESLDNKISIDNNTFNCFSTL